ncbi:MAG: hypothetical protein JWN65_594 [Solirubrobacterales bacterium]|nr:hypothetical protein [Solirubrobacterales bacterium]
MTAASHRIVPAFPVHGWEEAGRLISAAIETSGASVQDVAAAAGIALEDLQRQIGGEPVLATFELSALAVALGTTTGAWLYGDRPALFRGQDTSGAAAEAEAIGRELMLRHLALEASCG